MLARVIVALQVVLALIPTTVVAVWAFADAWPWPNAFPESFSIRGISLVLSGGAGGGLDSLLLSIGIGLASAALSTLVGAMAARAVALHAWRGRMAFEFAVFLPFLVPATVFAMGVQIVFLRSGLAGSVLGVVLAHAIVALPYAMAIMLDITRAAGRRLEDAARTSGAGWPSVLVHVTVPQLVPGIVSSMTMCYIISLSQYFLTLLVGSGRVRTFALVLFPYLTGGDRTVAGAFGLTFLVTTFAVFFASEVALRRLRVRDDCELFAR
jgi:putative spermidine/putrescine transport system permease protein